MIENLKHTAWSNKTLTVAGGEFWPYEVQAFVDEFERNARIAEVAKLIVEAHPDVRSRFFGELELAVKS